MEKQCADGSEADIAWSTLPVTEDELNQMEEQYPVNAHQVKIHIPIFFQNDVLLKAVS